MKEVLTNTFGYKSIPRDNSFKTIVIMSVFLSASYFYNIVFLSNNVILLAQTIVIGVIVLLNIFNVIYLRRYFYNKNFSFGIGIILVGTLFSVVSAYLFHHQTPVITVWAQKGMLFYLFYYVLHMLNVSDKKIIELITITGIIFAISYLIQFFAFPRVIFDVKQQFDRGTIRIALPGSIFMWAAYFISLQKVIYKKSIKDMLLMVLFLTILVLTGTRNSIANIGLVSFIGIIISKKVNFKPLIYFLFLACGVSIFFVFKDMFMVLIEMSLRQTENAGKDVRALSTLFYLTTFMPDKFCYILGNGMPHGASSYGREVIGYGELYGFYLSDIGMIGDYVKFGVIFLFGVLVSFIKWFSIKPLLKHIFTKYIFFIYLLGVFFGGGWANESSIVLLCCVFYILDTSKFDFLSQRIRNVSKALEKL